MFQPGTMVLCRRNTEELGRKQCQKQQEDILFDSDLAFFVKQKRNAMSVNVLRTYIYTHTYYFFMLLYVCKMYMYLCPYAHVPNLLSIFFR